MTNLYRLGPNSRFPGIGYQIDLQRDTRSVAPLGALPVAVLHQFDIKDIHAQAIGEARYR